MASSDPFHALLQRAHPGAAPSGATSTPAELSQLSSTVFPSTNYADAEKVEISQWLSTGSRFGAADEDAAKQAERLSSLNTHLSTRTTLLGSKPSIADVALYAYLAPLVAKWTPEERTGQQGYHHIVRFVDFVQNSPVFSEAAKIPESDKVSIDVNDVKFVHKPADPKEEKERKKKEKAAALAAAAAPSSNEAQGETKDLPVGKGKPSVGEKVKEKVEGAAAAVAGAAASATGGKKEKKEKKEKAPKAQKAPAKELVLSPALIDLRVGHILKAVNHPNADSLYVSTIACGDAPGTENTSEYEGQIVRTVCSGLNGLVPLAEMQGRKIVAVCNLKPVTMRGIKSAAMVLAASPRLAEGEEDSHKGPVELVNPPPAAQAGDRVFFEGWQGEPESVLNPKKKIWETIQPGFTTTAELGVGFDVKAVPQITATEGKEGVAKLVVADKGACTVTSLKNGVVR
ncbi:nucleic acid-binding protein [Xylona heveae TC161]|uniref:Nucleic acid-binding protein n=1 Tax=Xylona heveae (strain CBS 132557 / TC161) TaxID=1328760 RepID=A0A161TBX9_XYLHT|nr:nucleic acid-binding protein [Xylona heveae TC161]KZF23227.1 nucleic acid-binding protein [Xylona heveae TC161]